jgi:hypothetical protein
VAVGFAAVDDRARPVDGPPARLRSVLYMPGANERALEKAREIPADGLILDLEDAVAPAAKAQARERVCAAAASDAYGSRVVTIRVNSIETLGTTIADGPACAAARTSSRCHSVSIELTRIVTTLEP